MILLIHSQVFYAAAMKKYNFWHKDPDNYPVLVCFDPVGEDEDSQMQGNVAIIPLPAALKLISACETPQLQKLDAVTLNKVADALKPWATSGKSIENGTPEEVTLKVPGSQKNITVTSPTTTGIHMGQSVTINGESYIVMSKTTKIATTDPITGEPMDVEILEDGSKVSTLPGVEEIPIDPGKFVDVHQIAEAADPTEHVLDIERAV